MSSSLERGVCLAAGSLHMIAALWEEPAEVMYVCSLDPYAVLPTSLDELVNV